MAIIKCPECGGVLSDKAVECPHCGFVLEKSSIPSSDIPKVSLMDEFVKSLNPFYKREFVWNDLTTNQKNIICFPVVVLILVLIGGGISILDKKYSEQSNHAVEVSSDDSNSTKPDFRNIKNISEAKEALNNTVLHATPYGGLKGLGWWVKYHFHDGVCEQYSAIPSDGKWTHKGSRPYSFFEERDPNDGQLMIVVQFVDIDAEQYCDPVSSNNMRSDRVKIVLNDFFSLYWGRLGYVGQMKEGDYNW